MIETETFQRKKLKKERHCKQERKRERVRKRNGDTERDREIERNYDSLQEDTLSFISFIIPSSVLFFEFVDK